MVLKAQLKFTNSNLDFVPRFSGYLWKVCNRVGTASSAPSPLRVGKLEIIHTWFNMGKKVIQYYSFESFHDNWGQNNRL